MNPPRRGTFGGASALLIVLSYLLVVPRAWALIAAFLLAFGPVPTAAQDAPDRLSADAHISLITILPGEPVYTFAGHSALRVHDPERGLDRLYNYGTFDFGDPFFVPKFMYGYLRYYLSVVPYDAALRVYRRQGRPVIRQRLNLTPSQQTALYQFLETNACPENRYYQYDFFFDNCSTRIRDALATALGDAVTYGPRPNPERSFRGLLDLYVAGRPLLDVGFDLALGLPADRSPTAREVMFLPEYLMAAFDHASVRADGATRPLVTRTDTVQWIAGYDRSTPGLGWPFAVGVVFLCAVVGWTGWQATMGRQPGRRGDAVLFATVGTVGLVVCFLWFVSTYTVTNYNLNLAWAWPTHLLAAVLLLRRPHLRGLRFYFGGTAAAAAILAMGWTAWPQDLHWALLPVVIGVGVRAAWWAVLPMALPRTISSFPGPSVSSGDAGEAGRPVNSQARTE